MKALFYILIFFVWTSKCKVDFDPTKFDYCKVCQPETKNPNEGEHPACRCEKDYGRIEIFADNKKATVKLRELILDIHNELRNHIASGKETRIDARFAADMMVMNWDLELEYYARCRAMGSLFNKKYGNDFVSHESCMTTQNKGKYGQNLACSGWDIRSDGKPDRQTITDLVKMWYDTEVPKVVMTPTYFEKFVFSAGTGHLTQVIWSRANRLGCVVVRIDPKNSANSTCVLTILCDYYSDVVKYGGNIMDDYIYKQVNSKDETCTQCYNGTSCDKKSKYPYLCGKLEKIPTTIVRHVTEPFPWNPNGSSVQHATRIVVVVMVLITIFIRHCMLCA